MRTRANSNAFDGLHHANTNNASESNINCRWEPLREQILSQWPEITREEIEAAGPSLKYLSILISEKYHLNQVMISNYLQNIERYIPLA